MVRIDLCGHLAQEEERPEREAAEREAQEEQERAEREAKEAQERAEREATQERKRQERQEQEDRDDRKRKHRRQHRDHYYAHCGDCHCCARDRAWMCPYALHRADDSPACKEFSDIDAAARAERAAEAEERARYERERLERLVHQRYEEALRAATSTIMRRDGISEEEARKLAEDTVQHLTDEPAKATVLEDLTDQYNKALREQEQARQEKARAERQRKAQEEREQYEAALSTYISAIVQREGLNEQDARERAEEDAPSFGGWSFRTKHVEMLLADYEAMVSA